MEYTGTGTELLMGALIILCVLILPFVGIIVGLQLAFGADHWAAILAQVFFVLVGFMLWGMAIYRARRYRLSRTLWRGIRGTLQGSSLTFSLLYFGAMLLRAITWGWSTPAMNLNIQERLIGDMKFGETPFRFSGRAGPLYARYALCWFATPVLIAVVGALIVGFAGLDLGALKNLEQLDLDAEDSRMAWGVIAVAALGFLAVVISYNLIWTLYTALEMRLFAEYTRFDSAGFKLDATPGSLIMLWLGNVAILLFTLGIGQPFVLQRIARYLANRLSIDGSIDIASIQQSTATLDKRGEGLLDAFDVDGF